MLHNQSGDIKCIVHAWRRLSKFIKININCVQSIEGAFFFVFSTFHCFTSCDLVNAASNDSCPPSLMAVEGTERRKTMFNNRAVVCRLDSKERERGFIGN